MNRKLMAALFSLSMIMAAAPVQVKAEGDIPEESEVMEAIEENAVESVPEEPVQEVQAVEIIDQETDPVCICEEACTEERHNPDCPVCSQESASLEQCSKYAENSVSFQQEASVVEEDSAADVIETEEVIAENPQQDSETREIQKAEEEEKEIPVETEKTVENTVLSTSERNTLQVVNEVNEMENEKEIASAKLSLFSTNEVSQYTITWNVNGGNPDYVPSGATSGLVDSGTKIVKPVNNPVKNPDTQNNYPFGGWYDQPTGGNRVTDFGTVNADKTFYAQWRTVPYMRAAITSFESWKSVIEILKNKDTTQNYDMLKQGVYLDADIDAQKIGLDVPDNTELILDLNGHTLKTDICLSVSGTMILRDSKGGGKISGKMGAVSVGGHFIMEGGTITDSVAAFLNPAGGVDVSGIFEMRGGRIENCNGASTDGVYVRDGGKFYISGNAEIEKGSNDSIPDVYIASGGTMYANGGSINGTVNAEGTITRSENAGSVTAFNSNNGYQVTFDADGGSPVPAVQISVDGKVKEPSAPSRENYVFMGWYSKNNHTLFDFANMIISSDTTLTAAWQKDQHHITWDANGGRINDRDTIEFSVTSGDAITAPKDVPVRLGYDFAGWYDAAENGNLVDFTGSVISSGDTVYYAHWTPVRSIIIRLHHGGTIEWETFESGDSVDTLKSFIESQNQNYHVDQQILKFNGKELEGEHTLADYNIQKGSVVDVSLKQYTIQWNANGGDAYTPVNGTNGLTDYGTAIQKPENNPVRSSESQYRFAGWYDAPADGSRITDFGTVNDHKTFYAYWAQYETITTEEQLKSLFENGGFGILGNPITVAAALPVLKNVSLDLNGYMVSISQSIFISHNTSFHVTDDKGTGFITGNVIYNSGIIDGGVYREPTIVYNDGKILSGTFSNQVVNRIMNGEIEGGIFNGSFTNYRMISGGTYNGFVENYSEINGGSFNGIVNNYNTFRSISGGTYNSDVYSKVEFKESAGGTASVDYPITQTVKDGTEIALTSFPASGYHFARWDVLVGSVQITDNKFIMPKNGVRIQAVFEKNPVVSFNANGGEAGTRSEATDENGKLSSFPIPARDSDETYEYFYDGWYTDASGGEKIDANTVFSADAIVYAHWTTRMKASALSVENIADHTYTSSFIEPAFTVKDTLNNKTLVRDQDYTVTYSNNKNAGIAEAVITGIGNYIGTAVKTFRIQPKPVKIQGIRAVNKTYDGNTDISLDLSQMTLEGKAESDDLSASVTGSLASADAGNQMARLTVSFTGNDKDNYVLSEESQNSCMAFIAKADPRLSVEAVSAKIYSDENFLLNVTHKGNGVISYSSDNTDILTVNDAGIVHIEGTGTAAITVSLAESTNYTAATDVITVTVDKADGKITIADAVIHKQYGDEDFSVKPSDNTPGQIKYEADESGTVSVNEDGNVHLNKAGTGIITISMDATKNHKAASETITVNVNPKPVSIQWNDIDFFQYDGKQHSISALITNLLEEDKADLTYSGNQEVNAGTYTADITGISNPNYTLNGNILTHAWTITKRNVILTSSDAHKMYDGLALTSHEVIVRGDGFVEGQGADYEFKGSQTDAGESNNTFTYALKSGTFADNYSITAVYGKLSVSEAYSITYTDGVENAEIFVDQTYEVEKGKKTPSFKGTPERKGYQFIGWNPAFSDTVRGNITYTAQWKDSAAPVITGIQDGGIYCTPQTITVKDDSDVTVTVDGKAVELTKEKFELVPKGKQVITAVDQSGNEITITVYYGHADMEHVKESDATVEKAGNIEYWSCRNCHRLFGDPDETKEIMLVDTVVKRLLPEIIEGHNQSVTAGDHTALTFRSNVAFEEFVRVEINGNEIDIKNYEVWKGSTFVKLHEDYISSLPAGIHTIGIISRSDASSANALVKAETTFTVKEKSLPAVTAAESLMDERAAVFRQEETQAQIAEVSEPQSTERISVIQRKEAAETAVLPKISIVNYNVPNTADDGISRWLMTMISAIVVALGAAYVLRKR